MKIDQSRVNITEKDIEDWLYENPYSLQLGRWTTIGWLARQLRLPSGIADLVGVIEMNIDVNGDRPRSISVVEVKNVPITSDALGQVVRYAEDVREVMDRVKIDDSLKLHPDPARIVVGPQIDDQTFAESRAQAISVITFETQLRLNLGGELGWKKSKKERLRETYDEMAADEPFNDLDSLVEHFKRRRLRSQIPEQYRDIIKR